MVEIRLAIWIVRKAHLDQLHQLLVVLRGSVFQFQTIVRSFGRIARSHFLGKLRGSLITEDSEGHLHFWNAKMVAFGEKCR